MDSPRDQRRRTRARARGLLKIAALALIGLTCAPSSIASACSCARPTDAGWLYLGADNQLPRGARAIAWYRPQHDADAQQHVRLQRWRADGGREDVPFTLERAGALAFIAPRGGFVAGARYLLRVQTSEFSEGVAALSEGRFFPGSVDPTGALAVTVTGAHQSLLGAGEPLSLTVARTRIDVSTRACHHEIRASVVPLSVSLSPALEPFRDYLLYETIVEPLGAGDDDAGASAKPWRPRSSLCMKPPPGRSWQFTAAPAGDDLLYTSCEPKAKPRERRTFAQLAPRGLEEGRYRVWVTASSPDGRFTVSSATQEVELRCDAPRDRARALVAQPVGPSRHVTDAS